MADAARCAIVPPVPVPYREPLFAALAEREALRLRVIYQSAGEPGWDQAAGWFPAEHPYDAVKLSSRRRLRPGRSPVLWPVGLERALSDFEPACVVVSEFGPATLRTLRWARRWRVPVVILTEVTRAMEDSLSRVQRAVHRWCVRRAAGFVAVSSAARERLIALGAPPEAIEVSLQSADVEAFRRAAARARPDGPARVLSVGRLVPDKNIERLIEAFAAAGLGPGEAELEIRGSGPLEADLRAAADRLGVPALFGGYAAPDELVAAYAQADVFALVSSYEPFGVAVREAVAAGLPVVCTRVAGAAGDLAVAGRNALLVDPERADEIADALGRLCRDAGLRERMAAESRAIDRAHDLESDVDAFERAVLRAAR